MSFIKFGVTFSPEVLEWSDSQEKRIRKREKPSEIEATQILEDLELHKLWKKSLFLSINVWQIQKHLTILRLDYTIIIIFIYKCLENSETNLVKTRHLGKDIQSLQ